MSAFARHPLGRPLLVCLLFWLVVVAAVNSAVNWVGGAGIFRLDPRRMGEKLGALARYAAHRPRCAIFGEGDTRLLATQAARRHGLDPSLFLSLVEAESAFAAHRISSTGAMGPAQLMPGTAAELGVADPFAPAQGLDGGARYLRSQLDRFGEVRLAVAAYNAGPGGIRGRAVPRNGETEYYVARVMEGYRRRRALLQTWRPVKNPPGPTLRSAKRKAAGTPARRAASAGPRGGGTG
jgi:hypothetical protein